MPSVKAVEKASSDTDPGLEEEVRAALDRASPLADLTALREAQEGIRHKPTTERGERTFNAILDAAQEVLVEQGLRGITTRKVSDRAGVNIATLYQYFDDIEAIMMALSLRFQIAQTSFVYERSVDLAMGEDFEEWLFDLAELLVQQRLENESITALIHATRALPYLQEVVNIGWESGARLFATALALREPEQTTEDLLPYTRAANSVVRFTLDDTVSSDPFDRDRFELVCRMACDFVAARLTPGA